MSAAGTTMTRRVWHQSKTHQREIRPSLVLELNPLSDVKNTEWEEEHPLNFGAKNEPHRRETRPWLVQELNPLSDVKNTEREEKHPLNFGAKNMPHRRETDHDWWRNFLFPMSEILNGKILPVRQHPLRQVFFFFFLPTAKVGVRLIHRYLRYLLYLWCSWGWAVAGWAGMLGSCTAWDFWHRRFWVPPVVGIKQIQITTNDLHLNFDFYANIYQSC